MPLPSPRSDESKSDFISRFMKNDEANRKFPEQKQRLAVGYSTFRNKASVGYEPFLERLKAASKWKRK